MRRDRRGSRRLIGGGCRLRPNRSAKYRADGQRYARQPHCEESAECPPAWHSRRYKERNPEVHHRTSSQPGELADLLIREELDGFCLCRSRQGTMYTRFHDPVRNSSEVFPFKTHLTPRSRRLGSVPVIMRLLIKSRKRSEPFRPGSPRPHPGAGRAASSRPTSGCLVPTPPLLL